MRDCSVPLPPPSPLAPLPTEGVRNWTSSVCGGERSYARTYPTDASKAWVVIPVLLTNVKQLETIALPGNFASWDAHLLLSPRVVVAVFFPIADGHLLPIAPRLNLTRCESEPPIDECTRYRTERAHSVLLCPTRIDAPYTPYLYGGTLAASRQAAVPSLCGDGRWNGEYVVATKWLTYPMLRHPVMSRFDFFIKVDVDVCFRAPLDLLRTLVPPAGVGASSAPVIFFHTSMTRDNMKCDRTLGDFVRLYTGEHPCCANAHTAEWRSSVGADGRSDDGGILEAQWLPFPPVPYSNFIGGWLGFWQSARVLHFAASWHRFEGGWVYRWTDQQFWMPALRAAGVADASIVDFSTWRHRKFEHNAKTAHQCERPREVKNASDPCARKIQDERGKWVHTQVCWEMRMAALGKTKTKRK